MKIDELIGKRLRKALKDNPRGGARFGRRLVDHLGTEWSKQTVWDSCQGRRHFRVAELVAIARATNKPAHFFLDADAEGVASVEVAPGIEPVTSDALLNLFRIPEPQDLSDAGRLALNYIDGFIEDFEAQHRDLQWVASLLRGPQ